MQCCHLVSGAALAHISLRPVSLAAAGCSNQTMWAVKATHAAGVALWLIEWQYVRRDTDGSIKLKYFGHARLVPLISQETLDTGPSDSRRITDRARESIEVQGGMSLRRLHALLLGRGRRGKG